MKKELLNILKDIKYGWVDKNGNVNIDNYENFEKNYILQSPEEIKKNKVGICWDQVEFIRDFFIKKGKKVKTYFLIYNEGVCPTHTFLTYEENGKYYWVEHAWDLFSGIYEYNSEFELLIDVRNKYIENELPIDFKSDLLTIYEYEKPKFHISVNEFIDFCINGKKIKI